MSLENIFDSIKSDDIYSQVKQISIKILEEKGNFSESNTLSSSAIYDEYEKVWKKIKDETIPKISIATWKCYLSELSKDSENNIRCPGKKKGYYLFSANNSKKNVRQDESIYDDVSESEGETKGEALLYPILEAWLEIRKFYQIKNISDLRKGGKWQNPDIIALKAENVFNNSIFQVITIEAKLTIKDWEKWIFQAVAHTLFSNRSYFAFLYPETDDGTFETIENDLRFYAETFKIGILKIEVPIQTYEDIISRKSGAKIEDFEVIEFFPAPYLVKDLFQQKKFLNGIGINDIQQLYTYGRKTV